MKYQTHEFRIIFEPIDTPERERAKQESVALLKNLANSKLKDDFVLAGNIKVEPFCVICKVKARVIKIMPGHWYKTVDVSLLCDYIVEQIQCKWVYFVWRETEVLYTKQKKQSKTLNKKTVYASILSDYLLSLYESQSYLGEGPDDDTNIVDVYEVPEGVTAIQILGGIIWILDDSGSTVIDKTKKLVLSSTVKDIIYDGGHPAIDTSRNPYFKIIQGCLCDMPKKTLLWYVGSEDSVTIPDFIEEIGNFAFCNCSISEVKIPPATKVLGWSAFQGCKNLQSVIFSEGLVEIDMRAFYECSALKKLTMPQSLRQIYGACSFFGSGLEECILQDGIAELQPEVFLLCSLKKLHIPKTLVSVEDADIPNGCEVTVDKDNPRYEIRNKFLYDKKEHKCIQFGGKNDDLAVIPDTATLKNECPSNVYIPNSFPFLTKISEENVWKFTFHSACSVQFENGRTVLPNAAFKCSYDLQKITLPQTLTAIKRQAFFNCKSLPSIEIPPSVRTIECETFLYCTSLQKITLPPLLRKLTCHIFAECKSLKEIAIPEAVRSIEMCAFYNCASLSAIVLPKTLKTIGYRAFFGCSSLTEMTLPASLTEIHEEAFANCKKLKTMRVYAGSYGEEYAKRLGFKTQILRKGEKNAL